MKLQTIIILHRDTGFSYNTVTESICFTDRIQHQISQAFDWNTVKNEVKFLCHRSSINSNRRLRRFGAGFGLRSKHFPIRIRAHPRGAFISVRDWILTEISLLLLTIYRGESIL